MDLTFTDSSWNDVGIIVPDSGDFSWGNDENNFSIDVLGDAMPEVGAMLYAEGSDIGGIVTGYASDASTETFSIVGDTWTGVIDRKVLMPNSGQMYYTVSGDASACVSTILGRLGLTSLFVVDGTTGRNISHTFMGSRDDAQSDTGRYMGGWSAIWQMMLDNSLKCVMRWDDSRRKVSVRVIPRTSYTDDESVGAGMAVVGISTRLPVNHLVCLGQGEGTARTVVHLYADRNGNVSTTQTITGIDEIADVYDNTGADSATSLTSEGKKKLKELFDESQTVTIAKDNDSTVFDLGDYMGGTDERTGVYAEATISKKVASFSNGEVSYTYESTVRR